MRKLNNDYGRTPIELLVQLRSTQPAPRSVDSEVVGLGSTRDRDHLSTASPGRSPGLPPKAAF